MNRTLLTSLSVLCLWASVGYAEEIALVDTQLVLRNSIIGKAAKSDLEARIKKSQAKLEQLKGEFDKQRADVEKQSKILSGAALDARREALGKKQIEIQRAYQDTQEELARANDQELQKVVSEIQEVVKEVAQERKFKFVFEKDRQTVLYGSERIDISEEVVKILDKRKVAL